MSDLPGTIEQSIVSRQLFRRGQPILAAVSGGMDSMTLLHLLQTLSAKHEWRLTIAHFNHRLRGTASNADERFVLRTSRKLKLPFVADRADVAGFARQESVSIEMAARELRHRFLAGTARRLKIPSIAMAHHADDQLELFFLRLLRGAGGEGLAGMKWVNPSPADSTVQIVRPLLDQSKTVLGVFAAKEGIQFREDASNFRQDYLRNRVRHELLPLLKEKFQPSLARAVLRTMEMVGAETEFVRLTAENWLKQKRRGAFNQLHLGLQRQVIRLQLQQSGFRHDFALVEELREFADKPVSVAVNLAICLRRDGRLEARKVERTGFNAKKVEFELKGRGGRIELEGRLIRWRIDSTPGPAGMPKFAARCEYFDADKVGSKVVLRHWRRGDRFQPTGLSAPVRLQDLFVNRKIGRAQRHQLFVATTATGVLFWVEGLRIAECFKLDKQTLRRLKWRW